MFTEYASADPFEMGVTTAGATSAEKYRIGPQSRGARSVIAEQDDLDRLREEYADREQRLAGSGIYSLYNPAHRFMVQSRSGEMLDMLGAEGIRSLDGLRILELGCGTGGVLLELISYGANPEELHGVDLLPDRVKAAHHALPHLPLSIADGQRLPYAAGTFDLVLQFTVFTSILDQRVRGNIAGEMLRVLDKNTGMILWFDYWLNPTNPQARGIRPSEVRDLFLGCRFTFRRITLAPPITRRLAPLSWTAAHLLEKLKLFNSHYLVAIRPKG